MKTSIIATCAALVAGAAAAANGTGVALDYTTVVVTALTTYCPEATQLTYGGSTYTVTEVS